MIEAYTYLISKPKPDCGVVEAYLDHGHIWGACPLSVIEKVRARKRGNASNHPQYSHEDRLAAINKLINGK